MTLYSAAKALGLSRVTVFRWTEEGLTYKQEQVKGPLRIERANLVAFLEKTGRYKPGKPKPIY